MWQQAGGGAFTARVTAVSRGWLTLAPMAGFDGDETICDYHTKENEYIDATRDCSSWALICCACFKFIFGASRLFTVADPDLYTHLLTLS